MFFSPFFPAFSSSQISGAAGPPPLLGLHAFYHPLKLVQMSTVRFGPSPGRGVFAGHGPNWEPGPGKGNMKKYDK